MQHRREPEDRSIYDRWLRIQQKDAFYALAHLQNQLGTTQESVMCFQSTLHGMSINDDVLLKIKEAVLRVTLAMDEMRVCFKNVGFSPGFPNHAFPTPPRTPLFTPTPRYVAVPTIFQPMNVQFMPPANQTVARFNEPWKTSNHEPRGYEKGNYSQVTAQIRPAPPQPATFDRIQLSRSGSGASALSNEKSESNSNIGNGSESCGSECEAKNTESLKVLVPEEALASESREQVTETPDPPTESLENVLESTAYTSDQTLEMTLNRTLDPAPGEESQSILEQQPDPISDKTSVPVSKCEVLHESPVDLATGSVFSSEASHEVSEYIYDQTSVPVSAYESSALEYVLDQNSSPVCTLEVSQEARADLDQTPDSATTCETPQKDPELLLDETSATAPACQAPEMVYADGGQLYDFGSHETTEFVRDQAEPLMSPDNSVLEVVPHGSVDLPSPAVLESIPHEFMEPKVEPDLGLTPSRLSAIAAAQLVESILAEPAEVSQPVPIPGQHSGKTVHSMEISSSKQAGAKEAAEPVPIAVRKDSLEPSMSNTSNSQILFQTAKYRSGRESSHSNGSIDGFNSPVPSEARTVCNLKTSPQPCEVDELAKSLEEHWSLNDPSAVVPDARPPIACIPKSGILPTRIEEYRMPPPLEYVRTIVSCCTDDSLFLQLMEDEQSILKLDGPIEQGAKGLPLKFSEVQPGDFVLCLFDLDKRFYRARLLKAKGEDKFEVRFVDYGNKCITSVKNMRRLPDGARRLGHCAVKCELSEELKPKAKEIKEKLEHVSLESHFFACFAETYADRCSKSPIFTLMDIQMIDGSSVLRIPPPMSLEPSDRKFLVRNLVFGTLETAKIDLVEDLERKKAIADLLKRSPSLPCEKGRVKEGSLVAFKFQRARITKVGPGELVSLELIDEFQVEPKNIRLKGCSCLPLIAINARPAASCIVRVAKGQDIEMLRELGRNGFDIEMTVVGVDVLPCVKFSKPVNGIPSESSDAY